MNHNMEKPFTLDNFEGPLAFLLHLIQKSEINIHDVPIQAITRQYSERIQEWLSLSVDDGAEFISTTALLLLIKSKRLLPKHDGIEGLPEEDLDPNFEMIHQLLEYCHFKEAAIDLALKEEKQSVYFNRGVHSLPEAPQQLGIEHLAINDLSFLFENILKKSHSLNQRISEEEWRVSDKIKTLRCLLKEMAQVPFNFLFSEKICKPELIVNFLALLELMKIGECFVAKEASSKCVYIYEGTYDAGIDKTL
jgi:segregation and condensation protein A